MKQIILNAIDGLCRDFLYYDRKNDEDLTSGAIESAIEKGIITVDDMVAHFRKSLEDQLSA